LALFCGSLLHQIENERTTIMKYTIYKLISPSGKCYVGYTKHNIETRFKQHVTYYKRWVRDKERKKSTKLYYAFDTYHPDTWIKEVIYQTDSYDDAMLKENEYINQYNSIEEGYNTIPGGFGGKGKKLSDEHRRNISLGRKKYYETDRGKEDLKNKSQFLKENNPSKKGREGWNKGLKCEKISEALKGRKHTEEQKIKRGILTKKMWEDGIFDNRPKPSKEHIQKMANSQKGKKQTEYQKQRVKEANTGKILSKETRDKISAKNKNRILEKKTCPHCGFVGGGGSMKRWHFDNCKDRN